jgi:hypothetical protein
MQKTLVRSTSVEHNVRQQNISHCNDARTNLLICGKAESQRKEKFIKTTLDYKENFLCVMTESEISDEAPGAVLSGNGIRSKADEAEVRTLVGRSVTQVNSDEGIYVDEEGRKRKEQMSGEGASEGRNEGSRH